MQFEWDPAKGAANLAKHGVDFTDAVGVFHDEAALTLEDPDARDEMRLVTLGRGFSGRLLVVVWSEPRDDVLRIVSARSASRGEAGHYEG